MELLIKIILSGNNIVLATAHPCKFPDAIKNAINLKAESTKRTNVCYG